jgi:hypothetical protein
LLGDYSGEHLITAHRALWSHPSLKGCYLSSAVEPDAQAQITPTNDNLKGELLGLAQVPGGKWVACSTTVVREDETGIDWLKLGLPMGSLGSVYDVGGFPFDEKSHQDWREPLEAWLAEIGRHVYQSAPFRLGIIAMESDFMFSLDDFGDGFLKEIPDSRYIGYLVSEAGELKYYVTNDWSPSFQFAKVPRSRWKIGKLVVVVSIWLRRLIPRLPV